MFRWLAEKFKNKNEVTRIPRPPTPIKTKAKSSPPPKLNSTAFFNISKHEEEDFDLESFREQPEGTEEILKAYKASNINKPPVNIWEENPDARESSAESQKIISKLVSWIAETIEKDQQKQQGQRKTATSHFDRRHVPAISIRDYLQRLDQYICQGPSDLIMAFFYLNKYLELHPNTPLTMHNVHSLLFMSVTMANLMYADQFYAGSYLAKVGGVPTNYELALMTNQPNSQLARSTLYLAEHNDSFLYRLDHSEAVGKITRADLNKIIGQERTDFIFHALEKAPLDSNSLHTLGYELRLKKPHTRLETGHLYVEPETESRGLKYTVLSPTGKTKTGIITTNDLPALKGKMTSPLKISALTPLLPDILHLTAKRDHTISLHDEILKVTAHRGDTQTFAQLKNTFFREMDSELYIDPDLFEEAKETLFAAPKPSKKENLSANRTRFKLINAEEGIHIKNETEPQRKASKF